MDKYEKLRFIGRGAHGSVYLCRRLEDSANVIIKQIPVDAMTTVDRQSSLGEVHVLSMLTHPNIIGFYENFIEENALCIVMEYAPGDTLAKLIEERDGTLFTEDEVLWYFAQIVLSLHHLHVKQILHRDLKTANILMNRKRTVCKLSDFGISKILTKSKASTVIGTPSYLSPEICEGKLYNSKSDIWALGCVLYELVTLKQAFHAESLPALVLKIVGGVWEQPITEVYSVGLRTLLGDLLKLNPDERPSAAEVMAYPVMVKPLLGLMTKLGQIPVERPVKSSMSNHCKETVPHKINERKISAQIPELIVEPPVHHDTVVFWSPESPKSQLMPIEPNWKISQVCISSSYKAILTEDGRVFINDGNAVSLDETEQITPLKMRNPVLFKQIALGDKFVACISDGSVLMTFGMGASGCLGHGNDLDVSLPSVVEPLISHTVTQVACGPRHCIALTAANGVYAWGRGHHGRLGLGSTASHNSPQLVPLPSDLAVHSVYAGLDGSAIVSKHGTVYCTGSNAHNKLGIWKDGSLQGANKIYVEFVRAEAMPLINILNAKQPLALGPTHTVMIASDEHVYGIGANKFGQTGGPVFGDTGASVAETLLPCMVKLPMLAERVVAGETFSMAVLKDLDVWLWGKFGHQGAAKVEPQKLPLQEFDVQKLSGIHSADGYVILAV